MLMALLFGVGFVLFAAFVSRALLPTPWNRYVFLVLAVPGFAALVLGLGATIFFYAQCQEVLITEHTADEGRVAMAIKAVDCGPDAARTYDVSIALIAPDGKTSERSILRSRGRPAPVDVALAGPSRFTITMDDGRTFETVLTEPGAVPSPVWSIIDGKVIQ